jgi:hypothetical protein
MIGFLKEMVTGGKKPKPSRAQVLASQPVRNPVVEWGREARAEGMPSLMLLKIPRRKDRWGNIVARVMKLPDYRKLELDEIGSDVWEMCDGQTSVEALTKAIVTKYRMNRRQAETSVTAYLRQLAERRLIAIRVGRPAAGAKDKAATTGQAAGRRQKRA